MKRKLIGVIALAIVGIMIVSALVVVMPSAPEIPEDHEGRTTCFGCHESGTGGAPELPQGHLDKIQSGSLTDNVTDCLECHEFDD